MSCRAFLSLRTKLRGDAVDGVVENEARHPHAMMGWAPIKYWLLRESKKSFHFLHNVLPGIPESAHQAARRCGLWCCRERGTAPSSRSRCCTSSSIHPCGNRIGIRCSHVTCAFFAVFLKKYLPQIGLLEVLCARADVLQSLVFVSPLYLYQT